MSVSILERCPKVESSVPISAEDFNCLPCKQGGDVEAGESGSLERGVFPEWRPR